ncbi:hypothetical protein [Streptomyces sp. ECR3.8]|uniref:hypothetical protein n=1 Tax=Streptomyces sp. ECR3.8 TaxID=3461009 RepID=UPI004041EB57
MSIEIRFVGGPADGRTYAIPDETPPLLYLIPVAPSIADLVSSALVPAPTRTVEYEPLWENGWPRRADDGAYLYQHRAVPLTPEERDALERSRREVQAVEERRDAETDAAWQEIRKERPGYPADWRDLF